MLTSQPEHKPNAELLCETPLVSVVMPCLNEEAAVGICVDKIKKVFREHGLHGEVIVVDNGSTDRSAEIAMRHGARVVYERKRGYGQAYLKGFESAKGQYLVMGDADDTYDFSLIPDFLKALQEGKRDFVTGSRYLKDRKQRGMPLLHRFIGNPMLTGLLNQFFGARYSDVYCGFRAFTREAYKKIRPVSTGMEFNLELAINAHLAKLSTSEIPIELAPRLGESKLRTFRDGWRSLRMMLLYCPNKAFLLPGSLLASFGLFVHFLVLFKLFKIDGRFAGMLSSLFATVFSVVGFQILSLGLHAKTYSWSRRFDKENAFLSKFYQWFKLETGLLVGGGVLAMGIALLGGIVFYWIQHNLLPIPFPEVASFAATLVILGFLIVFTALFISAMDMEKRLE